MNSFRGNFWAPERDGQSHMADTTHNSLKPNDLKRLCGAPEALREQVAELCRADSPDLAAALAIVNDVSARQLSEQDSSAAISIFDQRYPRLLLHTYAPPLVLFVQGKLPASDGLNIAVVGARKANARVCGLVERLAAKISESGIAVVSGLAYGVDAAAHRGALSASNGKTVAVLGTPLDRIYPAAHLGLAEQIVKSGGALISQYPSGSKIFPSNFLERNRIIAGMCQSVVVAQAGERSGSLATARFALEENREVMALPGDALDESFAGSNRLIREGATLVTTAEHILQPYEHLLPTKTSAKKAEAIIASGDTPQWLRPLPFEPIIIDEFLEIIPEDLEPHEEILKLELSGVIAMLAGDMVLRLR